MKHSVQREIYEETKKLSWEEEGAYYRRIIESSPLAEIWRTLQKPRNGGRRIAG